ncbi:MAG: hypothetical protein WCZ27_08740 [Tissierellaceae bacterium]
MGKKEEERASVKYNYKWVFFISIWTFFMAVGISIITENLVKNLDIAIAFFVLILIILVGIVFDIIGIAVTTAEEKPFHAMAANKVREAKYAIKLVRNAGQVSNFCNDVIGDICGILSGALGTTIVYKLMGIYTIINATALTIIISSLVASFTVGGKALGKSIALIYHEKIIYSIAKVIMVFENNLNIRLFSNEKNNKR